MYTWNKNIQMNTRALFNHSSITIPKKIIVCVMFRWLCMVYRRNNQTCTGTNWLALDLAFTLYIKRFSKSVIVKTNYSTGIQWMFLHQSSFTIRFPYVRVMKKVATRKYCFLNICINQPVRSNDWSIIFIESEFIE